MTVRDIAAAVRSGERSAVDVLDEHLARIDERDGDLHAFNHVMAEPARRAAEAVDAAMTHGPGLRYALAGPTMIFHMGGGPGGLRHYLEHLGASQERRWASMVVPKLTPELCEKLIAFRDSSGRVGIAGSWGCGRTLSKPLVSM